LSYQSVPPLSLAGRAERVEAILQELRDGAPPEERFRHLFEIYYGPLRGFFARRGFTPEDCQELTQETFLGIYTGIGSFRGDAGFETWMWKIANNAWRKRRRWWSADKRAAEEVPLDEVMELTGEPREELAPDTSPDPGQAALDHERSRLLREAIERLPEQMRKCLMLRVYQDLKYREIAVVVRLSIETVKAHLFAARKRLQQELGDYFHEALDRIADP
jgi:RNA polymerase sigma-70 factor (ECF subfamily)